MKRASHGFTVIELVFTVALIAAACVVFFVQKNNLEISNRDNERKTAINAMYYSLENVYFTAHGYYPSSISSSVLPSVDPALFTDPNGKLINSSGSDYHYQATNCTNNQCKGYTLRASLENEADYIKTNQ